MKYFLDFFATPECPDALLRELRIAWQGYDTNGLLWAKIGVLAALADRFGLMTTIFMGTVTFSDTSGKDLVTSTIKVRGG